MNLKQMASELGKRGKGVPKTMSVAAINQRKAAAKRPRKKKIKKDG